MPETIPEAQPSSVLPEPKPSPPLTDEQLTQLRGFSLDPEAPDGGEKVDLTTKEGRERYQQLRKENKDLKHGLEETGQKRNAKLRLYEEALEKAGVDPKTLKARETPQTEPATPKAAETAETIYAEYLKENPKLKALLDDNPELEAILQTQAAREAKLLARGKSDKPDVAFSREDAEVMLEWRDAKAHPDYKRLATEVGKRDFNAQDEFAQFRSGDDALQHLHADACEAKGEYVPVTTFLSEMSRRFLTAPPPTAPGAAPVNVAPPGGPQPAPAPGRPGAPAPAGPTPVEQAAGMTDAQWAERQRTRFGANTEDQAYRMGGSERRDAILGGQNK